VQTYFTDKDPSRISEAGLASFGVDVRFMAQHANHVEEGRIDDVFEELAQTISLLQSESVTDFLDPDIRNLAYPRIQGKRLQLVLVKIITYYNSVMLTTGSPVTDIKRMRDMELVLKTISRA